MLLLLSASAQHGGQMFATRRVSRTGAGGSQKQLRFSQHVQLLPTPPFDPETLGCIPQGTSKKYGINPMTPTDVNGLPEQLKMRSVISTCAGQVGLGAQDLHSRRGPACVIRCCSHEVLSLLHNFIAQRFASIPLGSLQKQPVLHQQPHEIRGRRFAHFPAPLSSGVLVHVASYLVPLWRPRGPKQPGHLVQHRVGKPPSSLQPHGVDVLCNAAEGLPHTLHDGDIELAAGRAGRGGIRVHRGVNGQQDAAAVVLTARLRFLDVYLFERIQQGLHAVLAERCPPPVLLLLGNGHLVRRPVSPSDAGLVQAPRTREQRGVVPGFEERQHFLGLQDGALELLLEIGEGDHFLVRFLLLHSELVIAEGALPDEGNRLVQVVDLTIPHDRTHHSPHRGAPGPGQHQSRRSSALPMLRIRGLPLFVLQAHGVDVAAPFPTVSGANALVALAVGAEEHGLVHFVVVPINVTKLVHNFRLEALLQIGNRNAQQQRRIQLLFQWGGTLRRPLCRSLRIPRRRSKLPHRSTRFRRSRRP
mmetsp:Transcript_12578/g.30001  ORF Transcript_12578/g.30001 Transcript_12578/m.30001 type:complete len:530 (+) Transcript_12578:524-2113(+)